LAAARAQERQALATDLNALLLTRHEPDHSLRIHDLEVVHGLPALGDAWI
jgi:hypothetical protein